MHKNQLYKNALHGSGIQIQDKELKKMKTTTKETRAESWTKVRKLDNLYNTCKSGKEESPQVADITNHPLQKPQ